jgi:hypothetical protein
VLLFSVVLLFFTSFKGDLFLDFHIVLMVQMLTFKASCIKGPYLKLMNRIVILFAFVVGYHTLAVYFSHIYMLW